MLEQSLLRKRLHASPLPPPPKYGVSYGLSFLRVALQVYAWDLGCLEYVGFGLEARVSVSRVRRIWGLGLGLFLRFGREGPQRYLGRNLGLFGASLLL